jgi:type I restriction enzyme S subunit
MHANAYSKYKPSGVEWLGDVPEHWDVKRLKYLSEISTSGVWGEDPNSDSDGFRVATTANISPLGEIDVAGMHVRSLSTEELKKGLCRAGDIIVVKSSGSATSVISGKSGLVLPEHGRICFSNFTLRVRPIEKSLHPIFAWFFLSSEVVRSQVRLMVSTTTYPNLQVPEYLSFLVPEPPLPEQMAIADFLDRETGRMDMLVGKKRTLIEKLKEKRTALISRTVTRGLNPNAKLKPSGIEWLGDMPAHWEVKMLKRTWAICEYGISESLAGDGPIRVLTMGHIQDGRVRIPDEGCLESVSNAMLLKRHDLLFNRTNSLVHVGKVGLFEQDEAASCTFASYLVRLRVRKEHNPRFFAYLLNTPQVLEFARGLALPSINQANLNPTRYGQIRVAIPPFPEQAAIADYLDRETAQIDRLVEKVEAAIERLQEYRTALITAAVTGKIDVQKSER